MGKVYIWSDLKEVSSEHRRGICKKRPRKEFWCHNCVRDFPGSEIKMYSNWLQMIRLIGFLRALLAEIRNVNK